LVFWGRSSPIATKIEPLLANPSRTLEEADWLMQMIGALIPPRAPSRPSLGPLY
jgi:hypothetical protein